MPEFFIELFSEEIPARMQAHAADELARLCTASQADLNPSHIRTFYGPRRIALAADIASEKPGGEVEARGPRENAPEAALAGFLGKHQAQRADLVVENGFFLLRKAEPALSAETLIANVLPGALAKFSWPKSMRWGQSGDFTWVRPLRRMVCLLDGKIIPIKLGPVTASDETEGHRFMAPGVFKVTSAADWQSKLHIRKVIANQAERRAMVAAGLAKMAAAANLTVADDPGLADEVTGLVEWPVPLLGKIGAEFMDLPPEVRELSMKVNQRYFALRDAAGTPAPFFAFISNIEATDGGTAIINGNERVLRARLSDARHFWDLDLKMTLPAMLPKLEKIVFHAKIGTQAERAGRIAKLAGIIAQALGADAAVAETAGRLCKADLVSGMVGEFPELQGIMGGYYAERTMKHGSLIGPAIKTHYQPKGPSDAVPNGNIAISVALADKLDTLIQFFKIGEKPTGSGDPYALRRAALGVIRIILENQLALPLRQFIDQDDLLAFIIERLRVKLRGEGQRFDILDAVLKTGADDDLVLILEKVAAISAFLSSSDGTNLLTAYRRAANILRIEEAKDGPYAINGQAARLTLPEERIFADILAQTASKTVRDFQNRQFAIAMDGLAQLRAPVDAFFDKVTINDPVPEIRLNRLQLLARLRNTMHQIADFSKIEG